MFDIRRTYDCVARERANRSPTEARRTDTSAQRRDATLPIRAFRFRHCIAHELTMFHQKQDIKLIRLVKDHPVLYDHNNVKYMDFNTREVAWQKIGDELKRPANECKVRWINIRDVNRRILRKSLTNSGQNIRLYKYDKELLFMRPFYRDVTAPVADFESDDNNIDNDDNHLAENDIDDVCNDSEDADPIPAKKTKTKRSSKLNKTSKKKRAYIEEEKMEPVLNETVQPSELDPADPVDAFLLSIGATLKTFTPYHLNLAKSKIFAVVQEHDLQQIVHKQQFEVQSDDIKVSTSDTMFLS